MRDTSSPYLTTREAASFLRYSLGGFKKAVIRYRIPHLNRGHQMLFLKTDLIDIWTAKQRAVPKGDAA